MKILLHTPFYPFPKGIVMDVLVDIFLFIYIIRVYIT